jgi:hypothetical protein
MVMRGRNALPEEEFVVVKCEDRWHSTASHNAGTHAQTVQTRQEGKDERRMCGQGRKKKKKNYISPAR